jgi:hypothetical protein
MTYPSCVDAELLVEVRAVGERRGIGHLEPKCVGKRQLQLEVHSQVEAVAPVVGRAGHAEGVGQLAHAEGARDAADVVGDQPDDIERAPADVLGVPLDGIDELADFDRHRQLLAQLDQALDVGWSESDPRRRSSCIPPGRARPATPRRHCTAGPGSNRSVNSSPTALRTDLISSMWPTCAGITPAGRRAGPGRDGSCST